MLRIIFIILVAAHALIHSAGFVKEWKLAAMPQLSGPTLIPLSTSGAKITGLGWLLTCVVLLCVLVMFTLRQTNWWMVAGIGAVLSQILIVLYWHDAKFGTVANVIIAIVVACAFAQWRFDRSAAADVTRLFSQNGALKTDILPEQKISHLPPIVQKWMQRSGAIGKPITGMARIEQRGSMLTKPGGSWMPFTAKQYTALQNPGFVWQTEMGDNPFMTIGGRDYYLDGKGGMNISLMYLYPIVQARGPEIDQGSLVRYLAEIVWFPSAAANTNINWEPVNDTTARATLRVGGTTATGTFFFNQEGDCTAFEAPRYMISNGTTTLEQWGVQSKAFREFDGVRVPYQSEITWKLKGGDYTWLKLEITGLTLNPVSPY